MKHQSFLHHLVTAVTNDVTLHGCWRRKAGMMGKVKPKNQVESSTLDYLKLNWQSKVVSSPEVSL